MSSQSIHPDHKDILTQVQADLLEALLQADQDCYPWNPAEPEAEDYFRELDAEIDLDQCLEKEEMTAYSQGLFNQFHRCWTDWVSSTTETLTLSLADRFAHVPQALLEAIATQAQQVFEAHASFADQLVLCVKPLLPHWSEDDLFILARPWAYAMRGNPALTPLSSVEWTELSQMEQARLSLAVAHSALIQLQSLKNNP